MKNKRKHFLLVASIVILAISLPMTLWCITMVNKLANDRDFPLAGLGCFITAVLYLFSIIMGLIGLYGYMKNKLNLCKIIGYAMTIACVLTMFTLGPYLVFTILPLLFFSILYIVGSSNSFVQIIENKAGNRLKDIFRNLSRR